MKRNVILLFACLLSLNVLFAETVIKGIVKDAGTNGPLGYVNVVLTKPGQKIPVAGAVTNDQGTFLLSKVNNGKYQLEISFVGYTPVSKLITVTGKTVDLGTVLLSEDSKTLNEVQVRGQGPQMKLEIDKKVFTVDQTIAAAGASTSEMLRNIPSVDVDNDGNISLRNNANVEVWINGKPSGLSADNRAQILEQMPAESIEKVELITNPSAKYNPEGSAGIINLILKKNRKAGYYGSLSSGVMIPQNGKLGYNAGASINYNSSKIDAFASIGMRGMSMSGGGWSDRYTIDPVTNNVLSFLKQTNESTRSMHGPFVRGGLDYHLDEKSTLGFSGFMMLGSSDGPSTINYQSFDANNNLVRQFSRENTSSGNRNMFNIDLNYRKELDKKGSELLATLSFSNHPSSSDAGHIQYDNLGLMTSQQSQHTSGKNPETELKVDYTKKFSEKSRLEAGFDGNYEVRNSDITGYTNGLFDTRLSNEFDYTERNYAAYATYASKWGKFGAQLGLRGELSDINFTSDGKDYSIHYIQPFPSVYLSYAMDKSNEFQLNYTRRLNRPRGRSLNPFIDTSDSTSWYFGNPQLTPEYTNSFELNYLKTWEMHSLSASLYYRYTTDVMQSVRWLEGGIMMNTTMNGAKTEAAGLEVVMKNSFFRILSLTTTFNGFYSNLHTGQYFVDNTTINIPGKESFSWNVKSIANVMLPANYSMQLIGAYNAPYYVAQGKNKANYSLDFGLRKSFFNRKLTANLNVRDIFNSRKFRTDTWGANFTQQSESYFNGRVIGVNVSYNFGNGKASRKQKNKQSNEDMNNNENMMDMQ
ncbi:TonB-dependent receptor [Paludibacter sp.]|uniref:TonB-dependent receptor domain-containing protein n=1 Tax=Paludibacter sp. TaxID=1898105 RepID=UPI001354168D|nr:TonB-dependent receptor [Paludibacter sp.]MTK54434.1 TonB-dependent receptor [Paludibacter sp.]